MRRNGTSVPRHCARERRPCSDRSGSSTVSVSGRSHVAHVRAAPLVALLACLAGGRRRGSRSTPPRRRGSPSGDGAITIPGDGYGHGKGLSQYGAQGAAKAGLGYRQILGFYYPGTGLGRPAAGGGADHALTTTTTSSSTTDAGLTARSLCDRPVLEAQERGARRWRIRPVAGGRARSPTGRRRWHVWRTVRATPRSPPVAHRSSCAPRTVSVDYRGALRSTIEGHRSPATRHRERGPAGRLRQGGRAPARCSRRSGRRRRCAPRPSRPAPTPRTSGRRPRTAFDLCDTAGCQVYGGFSAEYPDVERRRASPRSAGADLPGRGRLRAVLRQQRRLHGGRTREYTYLTAKADPYDEAKGQYYGWTATLTDGDIERQWPSIGNLLSISIDERDGNGGRGGRVLSLTLTGDRGAA